MRGREGDSIWRDRRAYCARLAHRTVKRENEFCAAASEEHAQARPALLIIISSCFQAEVHQKSASKSCNRADAKHYCWEVAFPPAWVWSGLWPLQQQLQPCTRQDEA